MTASRRVLPHVGRLIAAGVLLASTGLAQKVSLELTLPASAALATEPPSIRTIGVVTASHTAELIKNGFPARLHYKLERWAAGTFVNSVKATTEWEVIVEFDALNKLYRVVRATSDNATVLGEFPELRDADALVAEPYRPLISLPAVGQKSYYVLSLDVQAMSLTDLDEVRRWLRGELRPAVHGERNPGTAVTSGLRTLFVRILGGERIQYQASTGVFRPQGESSRR
jgi:hypothetical protein